MDKDAEAISEKPLPELWLNRQGVHEVSGMHIR
jgi:hypothetical protein